MTRLCASAVRALAQLVRRVVSRGMVAVVLLACTGGSLALAASGPKLVVDRKECVVDVQSTDEDAQVEFRLRNDGDTILRITDIRKSCSCTESALSESDVRPGGTATLALRLSRASLRPGLIASILVQTNDPTQPAVALRCIGRLSSWCQFSSDAVELLCSKAGEPIESLVQITVPTDISGFRVHTTTPPISATLARTGDGTYLLKISIDSRTVQPPWSGDIVLAADGHPGVSLPVRVVGAHGAIVEPEELWVPRRSSLPITREITLVPRAGRRISALSTSTSWDERLPNVTSFAIAERPERVSVSIVGIPSHELSAEDMVRLVYAVDGEEVITEIPVRIIELRTSP